MVQRFNWKKYYHTDRKLSHLPCLGKQAALIISNYSVLEVEPPDGCCNCIGSQPGLLLFVKAHFITSVTSPHVLSLGIEFMGVPGSVNPSGN